MFPKLSGVRRLLAYDYTICAREISQHLADTLA
jgi:hypothetical protein